MQLYCQNEIVKRAHPWLSLEEAKKKDLEAKWCISELFTNDWDSVCEYLTDSKFSYLPIWTWPYKNHWPLHKKIVEDYIKKEQREIAGIPPTLARVLNALWDEYFFDNIILKKTDWDEDWQIIDTDRICERKLLNEDWTDATLRDQSEETQEKIYSLMKNK